MLGFVHRQKTCSDKAGGASSLVTQQWGLLPSALSPVLLPVGRGVLKRHREGKGRCPNDKMLLIPCPLHSEVFY